VAVEGLPTPQQDDLSWLRRGGRGSGARLVAKLVLIGAMMGLSVILLVLALHHLNGGETETDHLLATLIQRQEAWAEDLAADVEGYRGWIAAHGVQTELKLFDDISGFLLRSVLTIDSSPEESLITSVFVSIHEGLVRLVFLSIASLRLWIVVFALAFYLGFNALRPYRGDDLLGQTGNGRLFYSGARGGLDVLSASGAPDVLVRGLACPQEASRAQVHASALWRTLGSFGAQSRTNESLVAIILRYAETAPFVARVEDEGALAKAYAGAQLADYVNEVVRMALELHATYAGGDTNPTIKAPQVRPSINEKDYASVLHAGFNRVILPEFRELIGQLPAAEIATFVLALESGKVLAHSFEGGKWIRKSNFPQLSARAVLHSVLAYPDEYDFQARHRIRHALVYASRSSSFAAVRMPQGMEPGAWALRQWAEVLLACPHEIADVIDEVELVGLARAAHQIWETEVLPRVSSIVPGMTTSCFVSMSNLFFVPVATLVTLLRRTLDQAQLHRLTELSTSVSAKQRAKYDAASQGEESGLAARTFDRVFTPLSNEEVSLLAQSHELSADEVKEWSAMRNILSSHGWLARRVGDYTVPESSIIYAVFKAPEGYPAANPLGLFGKSGLVPLRGGKFSEVWGHVWDSRFQGFSRVTMSESKENFEKLMKGIKEEPKDVEGAVVAPTVG
jgi:hypothetical protein